MIYVRRVVGKSMQPALKEGQFVLVSVVRKFKVGDVVVAFMNRREVVKRITKIHAGSVYLEGDNKKHSTDSNHYGWLPDRHIVGRVIFPRTTKKLPKVDRAHEGIDRQ